MIIHLMVIIIFGPSLLNAIKPKIRITIIIIHSVVWPMVTNLLMGYRSIPEPYKIVGRNYQLSSFKMFFNVFLSLIPLANFLLPSFLSF